MTGRHWPPLIETARAPMWMRVRDFVITILAWGVLAWLVRDAVLLLVEVLGWSAAEVTERFGWREA